MGISGLSGLSGLTMFGSGSAPLPPDVVLLSDQFSVAGHFNGFADSGQQQYELDNSTFDISNQAIQMAVGGEISSRGIGRWDALTASDYTLVRENGCE